LDAEGKVESERLNRRANFFAFLNKEIIGKLSNPSFFANNSGGALAKKNSTGGFDP
jgi:hypothetical protein